MCFQCDRPTQSQFLSHLLNLHVDDCEASTSEGLCPRIHGEERDGVPKATHKAPGKKRRQGLERPSR